MVYIGAYDEAVQLYLDPGNVGSRARLPDLLVLGSVLADVFIHVAIKR